MHVVNLGLFKKLFQFRYVFGVLYLQLDKYLNNSLSTFIHYMKDDNLLVLNFYLV